MKQRSVRDDRMIVGQKTEPDNLHVLLDVDGLHALIPILLTHAQLDKLLS